MTHLCTFFKYTFIVEKEVWIGWCWSAMCDTFVVVVESEAPEEERRIQLTAEYGDED